MRRAWLTLMVVASAASVLAQSGGGPSDLAVTRLQGTKPATAPPVPDAATAPASIVSPLVVTQLDERQAVGSLDGPRRITLSVARPMPIGDLLLLLVNGTPLSLVTDNDVSGSFTGDLKDLTMRQALEAVLFPRGLDYDVQETLIRVFPRRTSTRLFTVNYLNVGRTLKREVSEVSTASSADFYGDIERGVQTLLSPSGRAHVDRTAGLVQVTDFSERLDQVGVYLEAVQLRATRQVRVDAQVLSIALWSGGSGSIDWTTAALASAGATRSASGYGPSGLTVTNIDAFTKALAEQGLVTKVSTPQIVAMNNEPAVVRVGNESVAFDGFTLTVLAQVSADGFVQLHVSPSYATHSAELKGRDGTTTPVLAVSQADTAMRVRDGETILLAGFLNDAEKIEQRSGFGRLFGGESRKTVRSELVVLLTPRIIKAGAATPN